MTRTEIR